MNLVAPTFGDNITATGNVDGVGNSTEKDEQAPIEEVGVVRIDPQFTKISQANAYVGEDQGDLLYPVNRLLETQMY